MAVVYSTPQIYVITNTVNGKQYIGQTWMTLEARWRAHRAAARSTDFVRMPIARAIRKYGEALFTVVVVHSLPSNATQVELDQAEQAAIASSGTLVPHGYNLRSGGKGGRLHADTKSRMSAARTGKRASDATRAKMSAARMGRQASPEERARLVSYRIGVPHTLEWRENMSRSMKGRVFTAEWKAKISRAKRNPKLETREKLRAANIGKKASEAALVNMRRAQQARQARRRLDSEVLP